MMGWPCAQRRHGETTKEMTMTPNKRHAPETKAEKRLNRRRADYSRMISQTKIGDGHRDATGYTRPGSNKK